MITRQLSIFTGLCLFFAGATQAISSREAFSQLQSESPELIQCAVIAVVAVIAFWLLVVIVGARHGYGKSYWLSLFYAGVAIFFAGLYFGVRGDRPKLSHLYDFTARTMFAVGLLYMSVALPIALRRRNASARASELKD